ncbi:hypothetical protein BH24CHL9_BH24CHL9_06230 [soil metagenome]
MLTVHALLAEADGEPVNPERLRHELAGNLCRCTGYRGILDAVTELAGGAAAG